MSQRQFSGVLRWLDARRRACAILPNGAHGRNATAVVPSPSVTIRSKKPRPWLRRRSVTRATLILMEKRMKRRMKIRGTATAAALALAGLCSVAATASAQFGLRGGMNLSKFVGGDANNSESAKGLNLAAAIPLIHPGPLSIVPEVYYSQKGAKQFDPAALASATTAPSSVEFGLDYIEVPLLAKVSFPLA